jgi:hypothetical protein
LNKTVAPSDLAKLAMALLRFAASTLGLAFFPSFPS